MLLKTEQPNAGELPWINDGKILLLAFEALIYEYGGILKLSSDIESEDIKRQWRGYYEVCNKKLWTYDEDRLVRISVSKRQFPVIKNRSECAVRNRLQRLKINTKGLFYNAIQAR